VSNQYVIRQEYSLPVDFSAGSERAVDQAALLAKAAGASVELLHVFRVPMLTLPEGEVIATPDFVAKLTDQAQKGLDKYRETSPNRACR